MPALKADGEAFDVGRACAVLDTNVLIDCVPDEHMTALVADALQNSQALLEAGVRINELLVPVPVLIETCGMLQGGANRRPLGKAGAAGRRVLNWAEAFDLKISIIPCGDSRLRAGARFAERAGVDLVDGCVMALADELSQPETLGCPATVVSRDTRDFRPDQSSRLGVRWGLFVTGDDLYQPPI